MLGSRRLWPTLSPLNTIFVFGGVGGGAFFRAFCCWQPRQTWEYVFQLVGASVANWTTCTWPLLDLKLLILRTGYPNKPHSRAPGPFCERFGQQGPPGLSIWPHTGKRNMGEQAPLILRIFSIDKCEAPISLSTNWSTKTAHKVTRFRLLTHNTAWKMLKC